MKQWMGADLSALDIMVVQIDGIHISEHLVLVAALGIDSAGFKHQIHKARNIMERLSPALHASVWRALRQAWELDDAAKAEKLIRNLAQRLERDAPGVSKASSRDWMKSSQ
jgi:hypothetical protein